MMPKNLSCIQEDDEYNEKDKTYEMSFDYTKMNQQQLFDYLKNKKLLVNDPNNPLDQ